MKKLILLALIALFFVGAMNASAADYTKKFCIVNNTALSIRTLISSTLIVPTESRIIRFKVTAIGQPTNTSSEAVAALYDAATRVSAVATTLEGEIESNDFDSAEEKYDVPLDIVNGTVIGQGAFTIVLVEYEPYYKP